MALEPLGPSLDTQDSFRRYVGYGDPGAGKTSWARSIITERTLAIDCGGGLGVLADVLAPKQVIRLSIPSDLKSVEQEKLASQIAINFARAFEYVKLHIPDWLIVDEFTSIPQGLETIGRLEQEAKTGYLNEYGKPDNFGLYGALGNAQYRLVAKVKALPCNLYMTCAAELEYETEWTTDAKTGKEISKRTGKKWAAPALVGRKIMEPFLAAFDGILYFSTKREPLSSDPQRSVTKFTVRTAPTPTIKAKLRALPAFPVPDLIPIGVRGDDGVVKVGQDDWTLARLHQRVVGTVIAK